MATITLNETQIKQLCAIAVAAPKNVKESGSRPYLLGVYFDKETGNAVATDGRILVYAAMPEIKDLINSVLLPLDLLAELKNKKSCVLNIDDTDIIYAAFGKGNYIAKCGLKNDKNCPLLFPEWQRVIPVYDETDNADRICYGVEVLEEVCKIAKVLDEKFLNIFNICEHKANLGKIGKVINVVISPAKFGKEA